MQALHTTGRATRQQRRAFWLGKLTWRDCGSLAAPISYSLFRRCTHFVDRVVSQLGLQAPPDSPGAPCKNVHVGKCITPEQHTLYKGAIHDVALKILLHLICHA